MKLQFRTKTIFLVVAAVAIACGGTSGFRSLLQATAQGPITWQQVFLHTGVWAPVWFSATFVAYALGRRQLTILMVIVFAISELTIIGLSLWLYKTLFP
jgi:hypothetical protein